MPDAHVANRIELECQVLSAALRCSWASEDPDGQAKACLELAQLFPDLLTPFQSDQTLKPINNYELLDIACDVSPRKVVIAYIRLARKFLRENNPRLKRVEYFHLLDAGFMLRKPRLRLSHDLVVSRANLLEQKIIQADGTFEMMELAEKAPPPQAEPAGTVEKVEVVRPTPAKVPAQEPVAPQRLPALIELLQTAKIIGASEVQALTNQMRMFPGVSAVDLILSAGYVTDSEMKSVQLGEFLLGQGKINMGQFCVAMYDERSTGVKMAESLQNRGWLKPD